MSFFKIIQKKGSNPIPPAPDSVRKELVHGVPALRRVSNPDNARSRSTLPSIQPGVRESRKAQANASLHVHARRRKRSSQPRLLSDSDSPDSVTGLELRAKRTKLSYEDKRPQRHDLRSQTAFLEEDDGVFPMVHAAHIASLEKPPKYRPAFSRHGDCSTVTLQYPSASQQETYDVATPRKLKPSTDRLQVYASRTGSIG